MPRLAKELSNPERFDVLTAAWVLACNDDTPFITYEGIKDRLDLGRDCDIREIIASRRELFRLRMPPRRLERWKEEMRAGRRRPSWIAEITERELQRTTIDSLSADDGFRSQFRTEDDAPKSTIELMEWGLGYLAKLREASVEAHTRSTTRFQMWLLFTATLVNVAATIFVGFMKAQPVQQPSSGPTAVQTTAPKQP